MNDLEIPLGKRTPKYRMFEMLPAFLSYGALILLVALSLVNPILAVIYLMLVIITLVVKAFGIAVHTIAGHRRMVRAQGIDWKVRLADLEDPVSSYELLKNKYPRRKLKELGLEHHLDNLRMLSEKPDEFPKPSDIYNAVIIAAYNEAYEVLEPTVKSVKNTTIDNDKIILVIAYEERGGASIKATVKRIKKEYAGVFHELHIVEHPKDLPNEVIGKGGNITYAGRFLSTWLLGQGIDSKNVIVTTLDSDNRPHKLYFDYLTYEYIIREDRKHLSYQPVSLFTNNIWDAPAPMRVVATGNSFWNIIVSMRPHMLRNFASHAQPLEALEEMNFWSTRTIVEDGHQYWRSYFHFKGDYSVIPLYIPIYQDAVLADTYPKTLRAQFIQLRRWAYGASDIPYVATRVFSRKRQTPFIPSLARLVRLIDGHVTLATVSLLVAFGGWVPLLINNEAARSISAHQLPDTVSMIQRVALIGLLITVFWSFKMLPPRPERYKRRRTALMVLQWVLMPFTAIIYSAISSLYSQGRLFLGKYLDKFDVTDKATHKSRAKAKRAKSNSKKPLRFIKKNN